MRFTAPVLFVTLLVLSAHVASAQSRYLDPGERGLAFGLTYSMSSELVSPGAGVYYSPNARSDFGFTFSAHNRPRSFIVSDNLYSLGLSGGYLVTSQRDGDVLDLEIVGMYLVTLPGIVGHAVSVSASFSRTIRAGGLLIAPEIGASFVPIAFTYRETADRPLAMPHVGTRFAAPVGSGYAVFAPSVGHDGDQAVFGFALVFVGTLR